VTPRGPRTGAARITYALWREWLQAEAKIFEAVSRTPNNGRHGQELSAGSDQYRGQRRASLRRMVGVAAMLALHSEALSEVIFPLITSQRHLHADRNAPPLSR
jgi:hypothetical protein